MNDNKRHILNRKVLPVAAAAGAAQVFAASAKNKPLNKSVKNAPAKAVHMAAAAVAAGSPA